MRPFAFMLLLLCLIGLVASQGAAQEPFSVTLGNDNRPMVYIPEVRFVMGNNEGDSDEVPEHGVLLSPYYIDQHEVTVQDFQRYIAETNEEVPKHGKGLIPILNQVPFFYQETELFQIDLGERLLTTEEFRYLVETRGYSPSYWTSGNPDQTPAYMAQPDAEWTIKQNPVFTMQPAKDLWVFNVNPLYPIVNVSWDQAVKYCRYYGKRLPTEAEWEYAASGGQSGQRYPWGDQAPAGRAAYSTDAQRTHPEEVGSFDPNAIGMYDMAGNAWEWTADWYCEDYYRETYKEGFYYKNPYCNLKTGEKVLRGGSWRSVAEDLRVTNRNWLDPAKRRLEIGFRCAVSTN